MTSSPEPPVTATLSDVLGANVNAPEKPDASTVPSTAVEEVALSAKSTAVLTVKLALPATLRFVIDEAVTAVSVEAVRFELTVNVSIPAAVNVPAVAPRRSKLIEEAPRVAAAPCVNVRSAEPLYIWPLTNEVMPEKFVSPSAPDEVKPTVVKPDMRVVST